MPYKEKIEYIVKTAMDKRAGWKNKINSNANAAAIIVYDKYAYVKERLDELSSSKNHANEIINLIKNLEEKKIAWENSVIVLSMIQV